MGKRCYRSYRTVIVYVCVCVCVCVCECVCGPLCLSVCSSAYLSESIGNKSPIPHTPNNTPYKQIETRNMQDSYSVTTHNTFDPLLNTEQVKTATAVLKNLQEANNHTSSKFQIADLQHTATESKDVTPKPSPKQILKDISIPPNT